MPKKIYKRFLILLRIILSIIKTRFRNKKVWTNSYKLSPKSSFSILLSLDCHATKNEQSNAVNSSFLGSCTLFKLLGGEIYLAVFWYTFMHFILYIHHILQFCVPHLKFLEPNWSQISNSFHNSLLSALVLPGFH